MLIQLVSLAVTAPSSFLILGGKIIDGTGNESRIADLRITGDTITAIGKLQKREGDTVIHAKGLVVTPGFIDAHSHADSNIESSPLLESQVRQGITTAIVGQDGFRSRPVSKSAALIRRAKPTLNFSYFSGHGGLRTLALGKTPLRKATQQELGVMADLLQADMRAGAQGLSSGLEYEPGNYSDTNELIYLARVASKEKGMYITHMRDESNKVFESIEETLKIGRVANLPVQVSHIKLAVQSMWGKGRDASDLLTKSGKNVTADVYPYLFWQSTIRVLTTSTDYKDPKVWEQALRDVGGPENVRLTTYTPNPEWQGKTLASISRDSGLSPVKVILEIIEKTSDPSQRENITCLAMKEGDLITFIRNPKIMFCSDGSHGGSHPRGAGSFPRILANYVREQKVISLKEAIRKMTYLPANTFKLDKRGSLKKGNIADIVIFNPDTIKDQATPTNPTAYSTGIHHVFVNGKPVLLNNQMTGERPGQFVRRSRS